MRGSISQKCIACPNEKSQPLDIKFCVQKYDPGACWTLLWSFVIKSKRHILIHTFCKDCVVKTECFYTDDQIDILISAKNDMAVRSKTPWKRKPWEYWKAHSECQRLNSMIRKNGELRIELSTAATMALWDTHFAGEAVCGFVIQYARRCVIIA